MKFCFVILHFKTAQDTIESVNSILQISGEFDIVIVDNASNNGSIEEIACKYKEIACIHVIENKENLGFAGGNNVGYKYAKFKLEADCIIVLNNDVIIEDFLFISKLKTFYEKNKCHVIGPDIISLKDGSHQNPMKGDVLSISQAKMEIFRYRMLLFFSKVNVYDIFRNGGRTRTLSNEPICLQERIDVVLHGSFIIFTPLFVADEDICFRSGTFLYMEELILYQYCKRNQYTNVFYPGLRVYHKEDSSTNSLFPLQKEKREFVFRNLIQSLRVYIDILREDKC